MPFELNPDNNKWEWKGPPPDNAAPVNAPAQTAAPAPAPAKPKPKPSKPWWQQATDAIGQAVQQVAPTTRYLGPGGLDRLKNDAKYEVKQLTNPRTALPRITHHAIGQTVGKVPGMPVAAPLIQNTVSLGTQKAATNIVKNAADATGLLTPKAEGKLDVQLDDYYRANGFKPPSEMTEAELSGDDARSSLILNLSLGVLTGGAASGLASTQLATKFPFLARTLSLADPSKAKTLLGGLARFGVANAVDELPSTFLDDNTGGSAIQLLGFLGADPEWLRQIDPALEPGLSRTEASQAALLPNFTASLAMAGGLTGLAKMLPNTRRANRSKTARTTRQAARDQLEEDGVIQTDDTGNSTFSVADDIQQSEEELLVEAGLDVPEADAIAETLESNVSDAGLDEIIARSEDESIPAVVEEVAAREQSQGINSDVSYAAVSAPTQVLAQGMDISQRFTSVPTSELKSLANPQNSPDLATEITKMTGRDPSDFTRTDILNGITALEDQGKTVMPSRLMGAPAMPTADIKVDPDRFQFKMGTDAQGQQKGNSLTGVGVWNEDMEGSIQVWTDPMNGETYVVNGHNRLAKAKELGIPTMKVEYINAPTAEAARAKGALTNIAQGGGTAFDAAKFMRDYDGGIDASRLESLGVPMKSGLAAEGLALSKLPDNIFQDAVDGRLSKGKALALGGSGLDETGMQQAYKALQSRDMTDAAFNEVLQQARNSPVVQGDQVDLFGNTDMLNLMVQKGELAARIRKDLMADKNLMARTARNANRLTEVGNEIDQAATGTLADDTAALLAEFDATKYTEGPTSQLLNEGAEQINNGAKIKVVADRIRRQLIEAAEKTPAPVKPEGPEAKFAAKYGDMNPEQLEVEKAELQKMVLGDKARANREAKIKEYDQLLDESQDFISNPDAYPEGTEPMLPSKADLERPRKQLDQDEYARAALKWIDENSPQLTRRQKKAQIVRKAGQKGEARPPSTPLVDSPDPGDLDLTGDRADVAALKALDNEARIAEEFEVIDNALAGDKIEADRAAIGYDEMTFDEKKGHGLIDGLDEPQAQSVPIEIPASAARKITAKTSSSRIRGAAESLMSWTKPPAGAPLFTLEEALEIVRRKGALLDLEKVPGVDLDAALNDATMGRKTAATDAAEQAYRQFYGIEGKGPQASMSKKFVMPSALGKSKPRFGMAQLQFESDLDLAAYMIRNKAKKSKGEDALIASLKAQGFDVDEVRRLGDDVKRRIQDEIEGATGSRRAPQENMTIKVPSSPSTRGPQASMSSPLMSDATPYDEAAIRRRYAGAAEAMRMQDEAVLMDIGLKLPDDVARLTQMSERLGGEMVEALKDAARISGLDPLKIQYLDAIDNRKMFGDEAADEALAQWSPDAARFVRENPDDPLSGLLEGVTGGLYVPREYPSIHKHMIYLALGPNLDNRLVSPGIKRMGGKSMGHTAYHEAFHAVQDWMDSMSSSTGMSEAINNPKALEEMEALIKKDRVGNWQKGMQPMEIQAEAFAVWYNNRKVRMKAGGVQKAFEQIKKFINTLRRKVKYALGKEPGWVDVFELASEGKIADSANKKIAKLTDQQLERLQYRIDANMDAMLPQLTARVEGYLKQKQADFDVLSDRLADEIAMEGC